MIYLKEDINTLKNICIHYSVKFYFIKSRTRGGGNI